MSRAIGRRILCLAACASALVGAEPRRIWDDAGITLLGGPSRDGTLFSYVDPASGNLSVRDVVSGRSRPLTAKPPGSREFAYFSTISPDSSRVAYAWFNDEGFYELRVIGLDGGNPAVLYRNEEAGFVQPCAWTPDGQHILTLFFRKDNISQIALVPAAGGPPQVLRSLNWVYPKRMDFSPDGRFIAYDSFAAEGSGERTIFLLAVDGSKEVRLVDQPGNHLFPLWTPSGTEVIFASDRDGTMDAWAQPVADGKPQGPARMVRKDLGRFLPLGITRAGDFFYGLRSGTSDVFVTEFDQPAAKAQRATIRFPGRNSAPAWSSDGKQLAYLSRRGSENFGQESRAIVIRSMASGDEREIAPPLAHIERVRWSPDGRSLLASGSDDKGRGGLYRIDVQSAAMTPVVREAGASFRGFPGVWSRDGGSIFYLYGESELRTAEKTLHRGSLLRHLAISPDGKWLALGDDQSITIIPSGGGEARRIRFEGLTELEWGRELIAGKGVELWSIPIGGGAGKNLESPGNRGPGFSLHPDGKRLALTAGKIKSEVWAMSLAALKIPAGLDAYLPVPESNPLEPEKVALGRKLFFDARLSRNGKVSCSTCHDPKLAFTDSRPLSVGIDDRIGDRRVPRIVNRGYGKSFFWDGRAATLEQQVIEPIQNPKEMDSTPEDAAARVGLTVPVLANALASYVRTILSGDAPFDRYLHGEQSALTEQQRAGLRLFRGKAGCTSCHLGPNFTDERLHNTGVSGGGAFKTPTLREAARTPPYMHDGSLATLADVIDYYDKGGKANPKLDPEMRELRLTAQEKAAMAAFLHALNGTVKDGY